MRVLVTGGSGFVGSYVILRLLADGYDVRTTIRTLEHTSAARERLLAGGMAPDAALTFVAADLERDEGWNEAAAGCTYVVHVASPFPGGAPKSEDDLIRPARDGALRVLQAARDNQVRRVVLTSSFAAVGYGHPPRSGDSYSGEDWTDLNGLDVTPYVKSKTIQERAAWDFIAAHGGGLELSVINPVGIFGPVLGPDYASSIGLVSAMLNGSMKACPKISFGVVDVRDIADLHVRAMMAESAAGRRFIATSGEVLKLLDVATILRDALGAEAAKAPRRELPDWVVRVLALRDSRMREVSMQLGKIRRGSNDDAKALLGWNPRPAAETIADTGRSLVELAV